jgi:hypothetical protein
VGSPAGEGSGSLVSRQNSSGAVVEGSSWKYQGSVGNPIVGLHGGVKFELNGGRWSFWEKLCYSQ